MAFDARPIYGQLVARQAAQAAATPLTVGQGPQSYKSNPYFTNKESLTGVFQVGNSVGSSDYGVSYFASTTKDNPIFTNPYGTGGYFTVPTGNYNYQSQFLAPGQSINVKTGQLSDPNLHADTVKQMERRASVLSVKEAGLSQAGRSGRQSQSVLASLDNVYFANPATKETKRREPLSQISQASQAGLNTTNRKTILGT